MVYNKRDQKYEVIFVKKCRVKKKAEEAVVPYKETAEKECKTAEKDGQDILSEKEADAEAKACGRMQSQNDGAGAAEKTDKSGDESKAVKRRALIEKLKLILVLCLSFLKIGLFTFGGGYAMIALIQKEFVSKRKWIGETEFMDVVAIAESTPGPLAINSATYIGYKVGKTAGAAISTLCVCIPSFVIIYLISLFFDAFLKFTVVQYAFKGIQVCVVFLIFTAGWKMLKQMQKDLFNWILFIGTFLCLVLFSITAIDFSSVFYILICGAVGLGIYLISLARKREGKKSATVSTQKQCNVEQKNKLNLQIDQSSNGKTKNGVHGKDTSVENVQNGSGLQAETEKGQSTNEHETTKDDERPCGHERIQGEEQTKVQESVKKTDRAFLQTKKEEKASKENER